MNGRPAVEPETTLGAAPDLSDAARDAAEAVADGVPCCGNCAHARVIPDVRPVEWRCRGGHPAGGLVYRGRSGSLSQYLRTPRRCKDYRPMGAREEGRGRRRG